MYSFIDLFCGIGGFRVALEKNGLECVYSSDIDACVQEVYKKNFGDKPDGDIIEVPTNRIPKHDVLCAGLPYCSDFDLKRRLFDEVLRIAKYHQPYILLLDNVKEILTQSNGALINEMETKLATIGYDLHSSLLNASFFGIPQSREIVYFVGIRRDVKGTLRYNKPKETMKQVFLDNILEKDVEEDLFVPYNEVSLNKENIKDLTNELKPVEIGLFKDGSNGITRRIYSPVGHSTMLLADNKGIGAETGLYAVENGVRCLTIPECKSIMGFPPRHHISDGNKGYYQLSNSIIPNMVKCVWDSIKIK